MKITKTLVFSIIFLSVGQLFAQNSLERHLSWKTANHQDPNVQIDRKLLGFEEAVYWAQKSHTPVFYERIDAQNGQKPLVELEIIKSRLVNYEKGSVPYINDLEKNYQYELKTTFERGQKVFFYQVVPVRKVSDRTVEVIEDFTLRITWQRDLSANQGNASFKRSAKIDSKLKSGDWYKIKVDRSGVYRLNKSFFDKNIPLNGADPNKITIYGYGGSELPLLNSTPRPEDMVEIPSLGRGLDDGKFDNNDYILFYAEGPVIWRLNNKGDALKHSKHTYSEDVYYFINVGSYSRNEPADRASFASNDVYTSDAHDFVHVHHVDKITDISKNVKSGKEWFGEEFNFNVNQSFTVGNIPGFIATESIYFKSVVAGRTLTGSSSFNVSVNGKSILTHVCPATKPDYLDPYVTLDSDASTFNTANGNITIDYQYIKPTTTAVGWLNYFELVARASNTYNNSQLQFFDKNTVTAENEAIEYRIGSGSSDLIVWDVTDINNVINQKYDLNGSTLSYKIAADGNLTKMVAFKAADAISPSFVGKVQNQNLHGKEAADVFIIAYDSFVSAAQELAKFHADREGYRVEVVTPSQIYNEFSSGTQDITAFRDFLRYFYENASSDADRPQYLILFGDASYDYKDRFIENTNLVPSYQSNNSINPTASYVSDDFYGLMDPNEGNWEDNGEQLLDIAIGRLPVNTSAQADDIVEKIKAYYTADALGDWRNNLLFLGDDEDSNLHFNQTEEITTFVDTTYPLFNIKKVHFDSYVQEIGPGGASYPDVEDQINNNVEQGVLVVNYIGHGGELGWAHERVLDNTMIAGWKNIDRLPLFITATCEFSRFDDPERVSAGENVFLNPTGGAIAMLTTTRVVYAGANFGLLKQLYKNNIFEPVDGQYRTVGQIIMTTKNRYPTNNTRNFSLLGDPTLRLAYPKYRVATTSINNRPVGSGTKDTLKALSKVVITGMVTDINGNRLEDFQGTVYPTIFDKVDSVSTLKNDAASKKARFATRRNIIYKGKATVTGGEFKFEFVVPKDIAYKLGSGKISYYAENGADDANGSYFEFLIGSTSDNAIVDEEGPDAELFVNDIQFAFGGLSNEDPTIIGLVSDDNGINTVGTGIGHELTLTLDDEEPIIVNEYYEAGLDDYQSGTISYPFRDLEEGRHSVTLKVWDVANNSATAYTEFVVANSAELALDHVLNYPNPFSNSTTFWLTHNRPGDVLDVTVQVFTVSGKMVKTIKTSQVSQGATFNEITWDGRDDFGNKIGKGVYVYRVMVKASDGVSAEAMEKLVILN